jgi:hypothetical protein
VPTKRTSKLILALHLPRMDSKNPTEQSILNLIAAAVGKLFLDEFPVLAVVVDERYQKQVLLNTPLFRGEVGPQIVIVVVFELLVVAR